jgi:hypothetical protein
MGNWQRVKIIGTCAAAEVPALQQRLDLRDLSGDLSHFGPLSAAGGLCGLPLWAAEQIEAVGNMAERDYDAAAVGRHLRALAAVAPSLAVKVHVGGDYESDTCVATVQLADGEVAVLPPEVATIEEISEGQIQQALIGALTKR